MRTLIWKEFKAQRPMLIFAACMALVPYVGISLIFLFDRSSNAQVTEREVGNVLWASSQIGMALACLVATGMAASVMAGERTNRTAEFLAYLPIRRGPMLVGKLVFVCIALGAVLAIHLLALVAHALFIDEFWRQQPYVDIYILPWLGFAVTIVLLLGVTWLYSAIVDSSTLAGLLGVATVILLGSLYLAIAFRYFERYNIQAHWGVIYLLVAPIVGMLALIVGSVWYLRRQTP